MTPSWVRARENPVRKLLVPKSYKKRRRGELALRFPTGRGYKKTSAMFRLQSKIKIKKFLFGGSGAV